MKRGELMKKIVIVEDDLALAKELDSLLKSNGYETFILEDFENTCLLILESNPDLILLDIGIPNENGKAVLQTIRKTSTVPIIMVTSKNTIVDEALSISYGADDFITKPYNPNILLLRIGAVLKRTGNNVTSMYEDLIIDLQRGLIKNSTKEEILTKNEMIIFGFLLSNRGRIVTRDELMTALWDNSEYINDNALTVNMSRLRTKLKNLGYAQAIETRKGMGYILL